MPINHSWMIDAARCAEERAFRIWDEAAAKCLDDAPAESQAQARREIETSVRLGCAPF